MNTAQKILTALFLILFGAIIFSNSGHYDWVGVKIKCFALAVFYTGLFFMLKSNEEP
jgi:hypothetical protein